MANVTTAATFYHLYFEQLKNAFKVLSDCVCNSISANGRSVNTKHTHKILCDDEPKVISISTFPSHPLFKYISFSRYKRFHWSKNAGITHLRPAISMAKQGCYGFFHKIFYDIFLTIKELITGQQCHSILLSVISLRDIVK